MMSEWGIEGQHPLQATFYAYDDDTAKMHAHALDYRLAMINMGEVLRSIDKYEMDSFADKEALIERVRAEYFRIIDEHGIRED